MLCCAIKAAGVRLPVDQRIRQYVRQQVADGIFNVAEVQRHTEGWVKRSLFDGQSVPSKLNRRYFPHRRDYENLIYRARVDAMKSVVDQENLQLKVSEWQLESDVNVYFRPYADTSSNYTDDDDNVAVLGEVGSGLLFVHQTQWQLWQPVSFGCHLPNDEIRAAAVLHLRPHERRLHRRRVVHNAEREQWRYCRGTRRPQVVDSRLESVVIHGRHV